jgi:hypothetical protein
MMNGARLSLLQLEPKTIIQVTGWKRVKLSL